MRDRDPERVTEQSRYGEPIGDAADQRRFGSGPDEAIDSALAAEEMTDEENDESSEQEEIGSSLPAPQLPDSSLLVWSGCEVGPGAAHSSCILARQSDPMGSDCRAKTGGIRLISWPESDPRWP